MSKIATVLLIAVAVALAGCTQPKTTPADEKDDTDDGSNGGTSNGTAAPHKATFVAHDWSFSGPETLAAGWDEVTLENQGGEFHHLLFMKLPSGMTYDAFKAVLAGEMGGNMSDDDMSEDGAGEPEPYGGPNAVNPGAEQTATVELDAGEYVIACWIPGPDGIPHALKGMTRAVTVKDVAGPAEEEPTAEATLTMDDFSFNMSERLAAGETVVKVVNAGEEHHEAALIRLHGNATAADFVAAFEPNATGPPPGEGAGGLNTVRPGATGYATLDLAPGRYAWLCFEANEHGLHAVQGMVLEFTVA